MSTSDTFAWTCSLCTFKNNPIMIQCEICATKKPVLHKQRNQCHTNKYMPDAKKFKTNPHDNHDNKNNNIHDEHDPMNTNDHNKNKNNKCKQLKQTYSSISSNKTAVTFNKWYWKHDEGDFKPFDDEISKQLNELTIGEIKIITIDDSKYYFKKLENDKCSQENIKTTKIRAVRMAKYKWFKQSNNGSSKPIVIADDLGKMLDDCKISNSIQYSKCVSITKNTENKATEKNTETNCMIQIIRKMILNDNNYNELNKIAVDDHGLNKKEVEALFFESLRKTDCEIVDICDVSKQENVSIYENILASKCKTNNKQRGSMEKYLWHGSKDINNLQIILKNGFDRSHNKVARFGKGTYFAKGAAYSVKGGYCGRDNENIFYIFLCKVIVGEYTVGNASMNTIPTKPNGMEYESLVDRMNDPHIFVSWRDYHALPYYLIKFKRLRTYTAHRVHFRPPPHVHNPYNLSATHPYNTYANIGNIHLTNLSVTHHNNNNNNNNRFRQTTANNKYTNKNNMNRHRAQPIAQKSTKKKKSYSSAFMMKRYFHNLRKYGNNTGPPMSSLHSQPQPTTNTNTTTTTSHLPQLQPVALPIYPGPQSSSLSLPTHTNSHNKNNLSSNANLNQQQINKRNQEKKDYEFAKYLQQMLKQPDNTQNTQNTQITTTMNSNSSKENQAKTQKPRQSETANHRKRNRAKCDIDLTVDNTAHTQQPQKKPKLSNNNRNNNNNNKNKNNNNVVIDLISSQKK